MKFTQTRNTVVRNNSKWWELLEMGKEFLRMLYKGGGITKRSALAWKDRLMGLLINVLSLIHLN